MPNHYEDIVQTVMKFASPTCILAGPGAGKTHLLADTIKRLLNTAKNKDKIMVLAYAKDARARMESELTTKRWNLTHDELPEIRTTHSLGLEIIKNKPESVDLANEDFGTQEDREIRKMVFRDAARLLDYNEKGDIEEPIKCKGHGNCNRDLSKKKCQICMKYHEIMCKCNRIDFDDQLLLACELFEQDPTLLKKYQSKAQYLLVDEYQDFNPAQFRLINLLSQQSLNGLVVVGDDAQTIYATLRGADTRFILHFDKTFPNGTTYPLPYSRRCPKEIMENAFKILNKYYPNYKGIKKVEDLLFSAPKGEQPYLLQPDQEEIEAESAALLARKSLEKEKDVLILVPNKKFFPLIIAKLRKYRVPYDCDENMLPSRISKLLQFLRWLKKPHDTFLTRLVIEILINTGIAKVPGAGFPKNLTKETRETRIAEEKTIAKLWESVEHNDNLFSIIQKLENPVGTLLTIKQCLINMLDLYNKTGDTNFSQQLLTASGLWKKSSQIVNELFSVRDLLKPQYPTVLRLAQLRTMRKAKGLEADVVIMIGLEQGIVPDPNGNLAEQARLFYVAMTRSCEKLYLLHSWRRGADVTWDKKKIPDRRRSCFLNDIGRRSDKIHNPAAILSYGLSGQ